MYFITQYGLSKSERGSNGNLSFSKHFSGHRTIAWRLVYN